jgi:hypothetical protein
MSCIQEQEGSQDQVDIQEQEDSQVQVAILDLEDSQGNQESEHILAVADILQDQDYQESQVG